MKRSEFYSDRVFFYSALKRTPRPLQQLQRMNDNSFAFVGRSLYPDPPQLRQIPLVLRVRKGL